jgi:hypothetical protein
MKGVKGVSNNVLGAIISLEAIVLGLFIGLKLGFSFEPPSTISAVATFGGTRHVIGTLAALIFIPFFSKQVRGAYLAAIIFVSITLFLTMVSVVDLLFITPGYGAKAPVPIVMAIFQILLIRFCYRAWKESG